MKKIAFIMPHVTGRGGTENVVRIVMNLLQNSEFTPKLYLFGGSEDKTWLKGVNYSETIFSKNKWVRTLQNMLFIFFFIYRFIRKEKPEMVIATHSITCFVVYWIRKITREKYPIVSWIHFSLKAENVKAGLLRYADYHLAICEGINKQFELLNIPNYKVFVVNNPIIRTQRVINRPKIGTFFLYVGRIEFEGQKRVKDLLDSLQKVEGNWVLQVIGDGADIDKCKKYADQLKISDKVSWNGWKAKPWDTVNQVTTLVMTSSYEGFGMVLAEAISYGVYCVSSDCEVGPSDIIIPQCNGVLYQTKKVNQLSLILQEIVDGKVLPDPIEIKNSISKFYSENYIETFKLSLERIDEDWNKLNK